MMKYVTLFVSFFVLSVSSGSVFATTVAEELDRVAKEVAGLELGVGEYILGRALSDSQKVFAQKHSVEKALQGTYKFRDDDIYVIAAKESDIVLGIYKEYAQASKEILKNVIGGLMLEHGEPTAMAHGKLVYWTYNENGKIDQDVFEFERESGGVKSLAAVKFSSSERIALGDVKAKEGEKTQKEEDATASAYVMISSDPLSKLFLAHTKPAKAKVKQ